jgi:hypothetical protein
MTEKMPKVGAFFGQKTSFGTEELIPSIKYPTAQESPLSEVPESPFLW